VPENDMFIGELSAFCWVKLQPHCISKTQNTSLLLLELL